MNARFSIRDNLESNSNLTEESDLHFEKQLSPRTSTESGMVINLTRAFSNAFDSIFSNLDRFSLIIDSTDLFP
jgi:hypothetical protein